MIDPVNGICSQGTVDYDGRKLVDINKAGLDLDRTEDEKSKVEQLAKLGTGNDLRKDADGQEHHPRRRRQ